MKRQTKEYVVKKQTEVEIDREILHAIMFSDLKRLEIVILLYIIDRLSCGDYPLHFKTSKMVKIFNRPLIDIQIALNSLENKNIIQRHVDYFMGWTKSDGFLDCNYEVETWNVSKKGE